MTSADLYSRGSNCPPERPHEGSIPSPGTLNVQWMRGPSGVHQSDSNFERRVAARRTSTSCGRTLPRTDPARSWEFYLQLTEVELGAVFKDLNGDPAVRPILHQAPSW